MYEPVLKFWFEEARPEQWWKKDEAFDRVIVERFSRYPHRNAILGRVSTAEEIEFLKQPGSSF